MQSLSSTPMPWHPGFFDTNCNDSIHMSICTLKKLLPLCITGRCTLVIDAVCYSNLLAHQTIKYYVHVYTLSKAVISI